MVTHYILHCSTKPNLLCLPFLHKHLRPLPSDPWATTQELHTCSQNTSSAPGILKSSGVGVRVGESGWEGWWGEVMWWDFFSFFCFFKALCLLRGWVISGGRAEVWCSQPWILVTGCWWSLPASLGTPRSGIYSQRCRSRNSADRRPSGENARGGDIRMWLT